MEFGMINLWNGLIVAIMMVPNLIYAAKGGEDQKAPNWLIAVSEQVGRYGSMALAILPVCMFALCGICLRHRLLVGAAALFGIGHLSITYQNSK